MIKHLRIQNFKGWKDTGDIRMAPITLLFGTNSSGKSSIGQFLMMLKQTAESSDRSAVLYPGTPNTAVQLGSYQQLIHKRNVKNPLLFDYEWSLPNQIAFEDPVVQVEYAGTELRFEARIAVNEAEKETPILEMMKYTLLHQNQSAVEVLLQRSAGVTSKYDIKSKGYKLDKIQGRPPKVTEPLKFYGFPDEVLAAHKNAQFVQLLNYEHERLFRSISYIGPLRTRAERLYGWSGTKPDSVGYAGENTVQAVIASRGRKINAAKNKQRRSLEEIIATALFDMGLIEAFEIKQVSKQRQDYEVRVRTRGSDQFVDLPDVGFGVSQVLPVLVQCYYAPENSIIIMEQPEIHLHPLAQAVLADVMIAVIRSHENGAPRNIQLIIETHSEHFLRRLQRRLAEGEVEQDTVAAYFANASSSPSKLEKLHMDECGNILNWPENFFGDEMGDIIEQAKASIKRRRSSVSNGTNSQ